MSQRAIWIAFAVGIVVLVGGWMVFTAPARPQDAAGCQQLRGVQTVTLPTPGYRWGVEFIPRDQALPSRDSSYWRCPVPGPGGFWRFYAPRPAGRMQSA